MYEDKLEDIPQSIERMKSAYTARTIVLFVVLLAGVAAMTASGTGNRAAIGCFAALTGVCGIMALSVICHTQLCLFRLLKEIRQVRRNEEGLPSTMASGTEGTP